MMAKILLVDDDHSMRHFLEGALTRAGHEVSLCVDGEAAFKELKENANNYDLMLTDIVMPGMDGIYLSQKAAELCPDLKIMFMTGFSAVTLDRADIKQNYQVFSKPFHLKDLVNEITRLLAL